jgi:TetR/AcrR family transcriptional repressor of nem operon
MNDSAKAIMDAAERRMRVGGLNGFSFRDIAAEVGIKSSSVHCHFPTKEKLATAVIRRYTDEVSRCIDREMEGDSDPVQVWTNAFRGSLHSDDPMCPCVVLGAVASDLPPDVAAEVKGFFRMCLKKLVENGLSAKDAAEFLSTITGGLLVANALGGLRAYHYATSEGYDATAMREAVSG